MNTKKIYKIAIAEDDEIDCLALEKLLIKIPNVKVVSKSVNGKDLLTAVRKHHPDFIIMDVRMDEMDGIEATKKVLKINDQIKVIARTHYADKYNTLALLNAGCCCILDKDDKFEALAEAIRSIDKDGHYYTPKVADIIIENFNAKKGNHANRGTNLNEKEEEYLGYFGAGLTKEKIADKMNKSVRTIEGYKGSIKRKKGIKKDAGLYKLRSKQ